MRQLGVIYKKETIEMWRNYKWIWIPLTFILFGIMQPVTTYYLPQILDKLGGFPEGTVIDIPLPTGAAILVETLSQFNTVGVLVLVLGFMGSISSEIERGVVNMIMVKPVQYYNFIFGKWLSAMSLASLSIAVGYLTAWYYTDLFIGSVDTQLVLSSYLIFALWLAVIITITLFFSALIKGNGGVAALSIFSIFALSILPEIAVKYLKYSPGVLTKHAYVVLTTGHSSDGLVLTIGISVCMIIALLIGTIYIFRSTFHRST